jgi:hypothetical protein
MSANNPTRSGLQPLVINGQRKPRKQRKAGKAVKKDIFGSNTRTSVSTFRVFYDRGDLPVKIDQGVRRRIEFLVPVKHLDISYYLPVFLDGLKEQAEPFKFIAYEGAKALVVHGGRRILACIADCVLRLKGAFKTRNPEIISRALVVLQKLALCKDNFVGEALVQHFSQLLPVCNFFFTSKRTVRGASDEKITLGDLVVQTLYILERQGGPDAFINIKYVVAAFDKPVE